MIELLALPLALIALIAAVAFNPPDPERLLHRQPEPAPRRRSHPQRSRA